MRSRIPPAPAVPKRARAVDLVGEKEIFFGNAPALEGRFFAGRDHVRGMVLCHAHPLYGGGMHGAAVATVAATCILEGVPYLRFHYRGVGQSEGAYGSGDGELSDVHAALDELGRRTKSSPFTLYGHSFGSWLALRAAAERDDVEDVIIVAPPVRFFRFARGTPPFAGKIAIFVGDRDEHCSTRDAATLARAVDADEFCVLSDTDHYLRGQAAALAERALRFRR